MAFDRGRLLPSARSHTDSAGDHVPIPAGYFLRPASLQTYQSPLVQPLSCTRGLFDDSPIVLDQLGTGGALFMDFEGEHLKTPALSDRGRV